jgi:hypothetical protein
VLGRTRKLLVHTTLLLHVCMHCSRLVPKPGTPSSTRATAWRHQLFLLALKLVPLIRPLQQQW